MHCKPGWTFSTRHAWRESGCLGEEDRNENQFSLLQPVRALNSYRICAGYTTFANPFTWSRTCTLLTSSFPKARPFQINSLRVPCSRPFCTTLCEEARHGNFGQAFFHGLLKGYAVALTLR